jgi:5'-3' exonuclease
MNLINHLIEMTATNSNSNSINSIPTFIFIDGSYFCFYRYHSLLTWWKNAHPEQVDVLQDPYNNAVFVEKFKKTFVDTVEKIPKGLKLDKNVRPIIIVGKDCKREHIWRNELFPKYKGTRANGPEDGFMGGPFFKMVYEDQLFIKGGARSILKHPKLEADDCIAITVKHLLQTYQTCNIYIITSDKDYLQLAEDRVHIYNLAFKKLTDQKTCTGDANCDLFCKIVTGDPSDNIPSVFPKCGPKTALKYFENRDLFEKKLQESELFQKQYELNKKIIDFNNIPHDLVDEFMNFPKYT